MLNSDVDGFTPSGGGSNNSEQCPKCGGGFCPDLHIEWVDVLAGICLCPYCGETVKINL